MQFMVLAWDGLDLDAEQRRLSNRQAHLDLIKEMKASGSFLSGGAVLDEQGKMIGSTLHLEFASRAELDKWLESDPYVTGGVWKDIEVRPVRLVP